MNLFIDTNIFLSFYHLTNDDLEELKKLYVLIDGNKLNLYIPQQVIDEFNRNRENKLHESIKTLNDHRFNYSFPQICKDYKEFSELREHIKNLSNSHSELINKLKSDINNKNLKADLIIKKLFKLGQVLENNTELIEKAKFRYDIGNPPGKNHSLGDAINWESMLKDLPLCEDLYFISEDKDYCSPLNNNKFNDFLSNEWTDKKYSHLYFYKRLSDFFKENFPEIKLASELYKDLAIRSLASSSTFSKTHTQISKLKNYNDYSVTQINDLISAATSNNQIYLIITDEDVFDFYSNLIDGKEDKLNQDELNKLKKILRKDDENKTIDEDLEIPF